MQQCQPLSPQLSRYVQTKTLVWFAVSLDPTSELFQIHDRHPEKTVTEPQSGIMYFIRVEEGLQVGEKAN
jgi:hypothetical protein